jgi:hypothetical protein
MQKKQYKKIAFFRKKAAIFLLERPIWRHSGCIVACNILLFFGSFFSSYAQPLRFDFDNSPPFITQEKTLNKAWTGGLNCPQFFTTELNGDGKEDLAVFDRANARIYTFLSEGNAWRYAPEYARFFPKTENWFVLQDYNGDGKKDLLTGTFMGVQVWKNTGSREPSFVKMTDNLQTTGRTGDKINLLIDLTDIPAWVDVDGDGDLDILNFVPSTGYSIEFHQNMSKENFGNSENLEFVKRDFEWGGLIECACGVYYFGTSSCRGEKTLHAGSTLTAFDADGDGDLDILVGEVSCDTLHYFENKGNRTEARFTEIGRLPADKKVGFSTFPAAFLFDADFDGKTDLVASPNLFFNENNTVNMRESAWFYKNTGGDKADFRFRKSNFLQEDMLDFGENALVFFEDLDGDKDKDLLIGNRGGGEGQVFRSSVVYAENTGSDANPVFILRNENWLNLPSLRLAQISLNFSDLDGDGKKDLIVSGYDAQNAEMRLFWVKNKGMNAEMRFELSDAANINLPLSPFDRMIFWDGNDDGKPDILVTRFQGGAAFFENTGNLNFILRKNNFAGIENNTLKRMLNGFIEDLNGDGKPDLLTGNQAGELQVYSDIKRGFSEDIVPELLIWTNNSNLSTGQLLGRNLSPALLADRLFVGSGGGGVLCLRLENKPTSTETTENKQIFSVYPNPFAKVLRYECVVGGKIKIVGADGRVLFEFGTPKGAGEIYPQLARGFYTVVFEGDDGTRAFVKLVKEE